MSVQLSKMLELQKQRSTLLDKWREKGKEKEFLRKQAETWRHFAGRQGEAGLLEEMITAQEGFNTWAQEEL